MEDLWEDVTNLGLDLCECAISVVASLIFWIVLLGSLALKQWYVRPLLEQYYKRTFEARSKIRKRQLRDTLKDPFLAAKMEETLLIRLSSKTEKDDPQQQQQNKKMLEKAKEELRELASDHEDSDDQGGEDKESPLSSSIDNKGDTTKGQERKEAAEAMLWGTVVVSILLVSVLLIIMPVGLFVLELLSELLSFGFHKYDVMAADAYCGGWGILLNYYVFCLIHLVHSYVVLHSVTRKKIGKTNDKENRVPDAATCERGNLKFDLEEPLLPTGVVKDDDPHKC